MNKITKENPVRIGARMIMRHAQHVAINPKKIEELAKRLSDEKFQAPEWAEEIPSKDPASLLTYVIILDTLNFCFWSKKEKWNINYRGGKYSGYFALAYALKRFFEDHPEQSNFFSLATISFQDFAGIVKGRGDLFFLKERWRGVRAVSRVMVKKYSGDPLLFLKKANGNTEKLVWQIVKELPTFGDYVVWHGRKIYFLKRAQILVGDIWGAYKGKGAGTFSGMEYLTAFPDYKLPQLLEYWGVFEYTPALFNKIKKKTLIRKGSPEEIEIRAATVVVVDLLTTELKKHGVKVYPFQVDWFLWNTSKKINLPLPHHLTKTVFY